MINTVSLLLNSWYSLLNTAITYEGKEVCVYKEDAPLITPSGKSDHYILLRAEGELDQSNKALFVNDTVVLVEVVTKFENNVNRAVVDNIDGQITTILYDKPYSTNLTAQAGMQIVSVKRETSNYLHEGDNINKYYRKISRYNHRITQTA